MFCAKAGYLAAFGLLALCLTGIAQSNTEALHSPDDVLVGVWGSEQSLGPLVRGALTIDGRKPQWRASIAGFDVPVQRTGRAIAVVLPDGLGEFRGRPDGSSDAVEGDWVQPAGVINKTAYATPVQMMLLSPFVWRGEVVPLEDRLSFYVSIQKRPDGSLHAVIINPEFNFFRKRSYDVSLRGSAVVFKNANRPDDHFFGSYDRAADHLSLPLVDSRPPVLLSRRNQNDAVGFFARSPSASAYSYRTPMAGHDGWRTASLAEVGIAEAPIAALMRKILTASPTDNPVDIDSLLIARHGKLVLEEYFHGYDAERPHDMRSASKTFAPVLVGIGLNGSSYGEFPKWYRWGLQLVPQYIVPAALPQKSRGAMGE